MRAHTLLLALTSAGLCLASLAPFAARAQSNERKAPAGAKPAAAGSQDPADAGAEAEEGAPEGDSPAPASPPAPGATPAPASTPAPGATPAPGTTPAAGTTDAQGTPAATGAPGTTAAPAAAGKDAAPKELTPEELEKQWHDKTPASLAHRLALGFSVGFGTGAGPEERYSADRMAAQAFVQYAATELSPGQMNLLVEGQYAGITGVDTDLDESTSVQYFLAGIGIDWSLLARSKPLEGVASLKASDSSRMRVQGLVFAGLSKRKGLNQETGSLGTPKYGASAGVEARFLYAISDRMEAYTGLGGRIVGYSYYDAKVGLVASF